MEKSKEVKKHAAAIHCSNSLSLLQRKISNALLYNSYSELLSVEEHVIAITDLCKILGTTTHNYDALKAALKALVQTVLEWNIVDDKTGDEDWSATSVLASVRLKGGSCYYAYSPRMRDLLHSPSIYGKINLIVQSRFKSSYGLALYENCIRYRDLPGTKWFDMQEFRNLMGVPDNQYKIFRDFKRRVIDKAVEEVNSYSDIIVNIDYKKVGRKSVAVKFLIKERPKKPRFRSKVDEEKNTKQLTTEEEIIFHQLTSEFGVQQAVARDLLAKYEVEFIQDKIQVVLTSKSFIKGEIKDIAAYMITAIKKNFQGPKNVVKYVSEKSQKDFQESAVKMRNEQIELNNKSEYIEYIKYSFLDNLNSLGGDLKREILNHWREGLSGSRSFSNNRLRRTYDTSGLEHPHVRSSIKQFIQNNYPEYSWEEISFEEFSCDLVN